MNNFFSTCKIKLRQVEMKLKIIFVLFFSVLILSCQRSQQTQANDQYRFANEKHLSNLQMLTTDGENAEAYFSFSQQKLIIQTRKGEYLCDQIFTMNLDGSDKRRVSTGLG
jgi:hypothetical protein